MPSNHYEVLIVGGGISGTSLFYELAKYTDLRKICLLEKYEDLATLNSKGTSNSQTIHCGDIETNYTYEKASIVKDNAKMVENYCLEYNYQDNIIFSHQKMAIGVGEEEVEFIKKRYEKFKEIFPNLEFYDREKLKEIEPKVVFDSYGNYRKENVVGMGSRNEYTTIDYGKMSKSFIENALKFKTDDTKMDLFLNTCVKSISKNGDIFELETNKDKYTADFVVVNAGAHSLFLAHSMGYGLDWGCLPVAGSFYLTTKKILNGKVYMVQNPKLPFAALHGDPDVLANNFTRFGPTALILPKLERYKSGTYLDFLKTLRLDMNVLKVFFDLLKDSDIRNYIFRNFLFEIPYFNKGFFLKDARKIVPSLQAEDIEYAQGFGGIRPQVINKKEKKLMLGEASILEEGIIFNMTPSPGATTCLANAKRDIFLIKDRLNFNFDEDKFKTELE